MALEPIAVGGYFNRDASSDVIILDTSSSEPAEPVEYTYTFPTGKPLHVEVSGSGYTTLSANVTMTADKTVTADLINGTITGGDVAHPDYCTVTANNGAYIMRIYNLDEDPNMNGDGVNVSNQASSPVTVGTYPYGTQIGVLVDYEKPMSPADLKINGTVVVQASEFTSYSYDWETTYTFTLTEDSYIQAGAYGVPGGEVVIK